MSGPRRWALAMLVLGSLQMAGDVLRVPALVGLGAASHVAPAPKVFTTLGEGEPFSARFAVELEYADGHRTRLDLDRARYARLRGPYNRRNVVGALVAGGPHLGDDATLGPLFVAAGRWALCEGALLQELGAPAGHGDVVRGAFVQTRAGRRWRWSLAC
ncbi:MAG: hypothetical protein AAF447_16325 [Myxococcota bacterium]